MRAASASRALLSAFAHQASSNLEIQIGTLEEEDLIVRTVYAEVPPRVEYRLSAQGEALRPVIDALRLWGGVRRQAERLSQEPVSEHVASNCR